MQGSVSLAPHHNRDAVWKNLLDGRVFHNGSNSGSPEVAHRSGASSLAPVCRIGRPDLLDYRPARGFHNSHSTLLSSLSVEFLALGDGVYHLISDKAQKFLSGTTLSQ